MDRRQFCRNSLATGLAAAYPMLTACGERTPVATTADTVIPAIALDGSELKLEKAAVKEFGESLTGPVLLSGHPKYDKARGIWNGMHDKKPALIARCADAQDVSRAVTFAHDRNLLLAVHGGGHSWPGKSVCDGGMMLDLSMMDAVDVDPDRQIAESGGGALLHDLDTAAREHELITTAGVISHTGVGGFTLGGGLGRVNRKFGLAIDNLNAAEVVTADGQIRRASESEEPDLYWGIRGGGGNFGVVTNFEYRLHPFPLKPYTGMVMWPIEEAREVLEFYSDWHRELPDDMYTGPIMLTTPEGQGLLVMEVLYTGDPAEGEKIAQPLFNVGKPVDNTVGVNDYMMMQTKDDETFRTGIRSYAKSGMVEGFTPDLVDAMLDAYKPDPRIMFFTHTLGGAVNEVDELATAFPHRNAEALLVIASVWNDPAEDQQVIDGAREWYYDLEPLMGGYYDNIAFDREQVAGNYGPAYDRLSKIKAHYDPDNLFRLNSNVEPAV